MSQDYTLLSPEDQAELLKQVGSTEIEEIVNSGLMFGSNEPYYLTARDDFNLQMYDECTNPLEDTKDFQRNYQISHESFYLTALKNSLANDDYEGIYKFEVSAAPVFSNKSTWVYSVVLNKLFISMGTKFPMNFKIVEHPNNPLFIRVTPQYSQDRSDRVIRCINHGDITDPSNANLADSSIRPHIIRCENPKAHYVGSKDRNDYLSVVVPFSRPQVGLDGIDEMFSFVCMSTCANPGINRRQLEIIFTLENEKGDVLGRRCLNVRICACPKRDKEKEEEAYKKTQNGLPPKGKKRKVNQTTVNSAPADNDTREFSIKIVGKKNYLKLLDYAQALVGNDLRTCRGQIAESLYQSNYDDIQHKIANPP